MDDLYTAQTGIRSFYLEEQGEELLLDFDGFMIRDLIISNNSSDWVALYVKDDDGHQESIVEIEGRNTFSHQFHNGFRFWRNARLYALKDGNNGSCNICVSYVKTQVRNYSSWRER